MKVFICLLVCLPTFSLTLKHGDSCSWEAEKPRQKFLQSNSPGLHNGLGNELEGLEDKVCPAEQNMVCDKNTQKCVCGVPDLELLNGRVVEHFALEEHGKCRWAMGASCFPEEWAAKHLNFTYSMTDLKCESGTSCKTKNGAICSEAALNHPLAYMNMDNEKMMMKEVLSDRVCSCQQNLDAKGITRVEEIPRAEAHTHDTSITILIGKSRSVGFTLTPCFYQAITSLVIWSVMVRYPFWT